MNVFEMAFWIFIGTVLFVAGFHVLAFVAATIFAWILQLIER